MTVRILNIPEQQPTPAEPAVQYRPDDDIIAADVALEWNGLVSYFHGDWHKYEGGYWQRRDVHELRRFLRIHLRRYRDRGVQVNSRRVGGLAQMLEDDLYVADRKINESSQEARKYINLQNGLFNLETFQLEPHRPDLFFTTQLDFAYDPNADDPTFRSYLNRSLVYPDDPDKTDNTLVMLVHQALAYSMTSRTDLKASFWLVGKPDSGKSTFIALIRSLMGNLHSTIDLNQLAVNRFLLSEIVDKRVVTFTEANSNTVLPDALYKAMVGGEDEIYADVKNKPGIAFKPTAKFWWAMNESPRVADRSDAVFNRLVIIPFNRSIPKKDRVANLVEKLAAEKPGIFNTLMNAYRRMNRQGHFERCEQSINIRSAYQMENDTEGTFLEEDTEVAPRARIQSENLYTIYKKWCDRNGFRPKNRNQVAKDWERLGLEKNRSDGKTYWHGRKIREDVHVS